MIFRSRRRARPAPFLNERGQGLAWLLGALALILWVVAKAKGV